MRDAPSPELTQLLAHLRLAGPDELRAAHRRAARLARRVPLFDAVWIDALVQTGALSLFQASLLHADRGDELELAGYVLVDRIDTLGAITSYRARHRETQRPARLTVAQLDDWADAQPRIANLLERSKRVHSPHVAPVMAAESIVASDNENLGSRAVLACDWIDGTTLEQRLMQSGRFAPHQVVGFARQAIRGLQALELAGLVHGDLCLREITLGPSGVLTLTAPGVRAAVRPVEGYAFAELAPQAYATVAPERIRTGSTASRSADIYALGVICWHLLAGRAPFPLANSLATLKAIERGKVPDLRQVTVDVPPALADTIHACLSADPLDRPQTYDELAARLDEVRAPQTHQLRYRSQPVTAVWHRAAEMTPLRSSAAGAAALVLIGLLLWFRSGATPPSVVLRSPTRQASDAKIPPADAAEQSADRPTTDSAAPADNAAPRESAVVPAAYTAPAEAPALILPSDRPLYLESITPAAGQTVRGQGELRPQIWLTRGSLAVTADRVRFVNIDFVWAAPEGESSQPACLFRLQSSRIEFEGCSFQSADKAHRTAVVVEAPPRASRGAGPLGLPSTVCEFRDCTVRGLSGLIRHERDDALVARLANVLVLQADNLVTIQTVPARDAPAVVMMRNCTIREVERLIELPPIEGIPSPGRVSVLADQCVLSPSREGCLVAVRGGDGWRWLAEFEWRGQGSIVEQQARLVQWQRHDELIELDERLQVTGLVRSEIEFAGPASTDVGDSQIRHWSAPLLSDDPPGADSVRLSLPTIDRKNRSVSNLTTPAE